MGQRLHKDHKIGQDQIEEKEVTIPIINYCLEARFQMKKYVVVENFESPQHDGGFEQSHWMEAHMGIVQSMMCLGQMRVRMGKDEDWTENSNMHDQKRI